MANMVLWRPRVFSHYRFCLLFCCGQTCGNEIFVSIHAVTDETEIQYVHRENDHEIQSGG